MVSAIKTGKNKRNGQGYEADSVGDKIRAEIEKYFNLKTDNTGSWWVKWWFLPTGIEKSSDDVPNFKEMNDAAVRLADIDTRKKFAEMCAGVIAEKVLNMFMR